MGTMLRAEEVALLVGCSVKTINNWYWFKERYPDNEHIQILPDFIRHGSRGTRYWDKDEIWKLIEFRQTIPKGRNGFLGNVTQKYYRKKGKKNEQIKN